MQFQIIKQQFSIVLTVFLVTLSFLLSGCAERNSVKVAEDTSTFELLGQVQTPGWAQNVFVHGDTAYIADDEMGVAFINVSNKTAPVYDRSLYIGSEVLNVKLANTQHRGLLFILARNGLTYYNLSDYSRAGTTGSGYISDFDFIEVAPDSLHLSTIDYLVGGDGWKIYRFYFYDLWDAWSDQYNQTLHASESSYRGIAMHDSICFVAHEQAGLDIYKIDYSTQGNFPTTLLSNIDTPGSAYDVVANSSKSHVFVADYNGGVQIINVTDLSNPTFVTNLKPNNSDRVIKLEIVGDTLYFIDNLISFYAADVSNPSSPRIIGEYRSTDPTGMHITPDHTIYLADETDGLIILKWR